MLLPPSAPVAAAIVATIPASPPPAARPAASAAGAGGVAFAFTSASITMRLIPPRKPRFSTRILWVS